MEAFIEDVLTHRRPATAANRYRSLQQLFGETPARVFDPGFFVAARDEWRKALENLCK